MCIDSQRYKYWYIRRGELLRDRWVLLVWRRLLLILRLHPSVLRTRRPQPHDSNHILLCMLAYFFVSCPIFKWITAYASLLININRNSGKQTSKHVADNDNGLLSKIFLSADTRWGRQCADVVPDGLPSVLRQLVALWDREWGVALVGQVLRWRRQPQRHCRRLAGSFPIFSTFCPQGNSSTFRSARRLATLCPQSLIECSTPPNAIVCFYKWIFLIYVQH